MSIAKIGVFFDGILSQFFNDIVGLFISVGRNIDCEIFIHLPGIIVLQSVYHHVCDSERSRYDSRSISTMYPLFQDLYFQLSSNIASQRTCDPHVLIVQSPGVQAEDHFRVSDLLFQGDHVVVDMTSTFFVSFSNHDDS